MGEKKKVTLPKWLLYLLLIIEIGLFIFFVIFIDRENQTAREVAITADSVSFGLTLSITINVTFNIDAKVIALFSKVSLNEGNNNSKEDELINGLELHLSSVSKVEHKVKEIKALRDDFRHIEIVDARNQLATFLVRCDEDLAPIKGSVDKTQYIDECLNTIENYYKDVRGFLSHIQSDKKMMSIMWMQLGKNLFNEFDDAYEKVKGVHIVLPPRTKK